MVKWVSMRDVGAWFEVASGRNRPRGSAGRGETPASRSSHENVIFARTNPSRSNPVTQIHTVLRRCFPPNAMQEKTRNNPGPQITQMDTDGKREFKFMICDHLRHLPAHFAHWLVMFHSAIPDLVVPLLLSVSASLRGKSDS